MSKWWTAHSQEVILPKQKIIISIQIKNYDGHDMLELVSVKFI